MGKKLKNLDKGKSSRIRKHTIYKKPCPITKKNPKAVYNQVRHNAI